MVARAGHVAIPVSAQCLLPPDLSVGVRVLATGVIRHFAWGGRPASAASLLYAFAPFHFTTWQAPFVPVRLLADPAGRTGGGMGEHMKVWLGASDAVRPGGAGNYGAATSSASCWRRPGVTMPSSRASSCLWPSIVAAARQQSWRRIARPALALVVARCAGLGGQSMAESCRIFSDTRMRCRPAASG